MEESLDNEFNDNLSSYMTNKKYIYIPRKKILRSCRACMKFVNGVIKRSPIKTPSNVKSAVKSYCVENMKKLFYKSYFLPYFCGEKVSKSDRFVELVVKYQQPSKICNKLGMC